MRPRGDPHGHAALEEDDPQNDLAATFDYLTSRSGTHRPHLHGRGAHVDPPGARSRYLVYSVSLVSYRYLGFTAGFVFLVRLIYWLYLRSRLVSSHLVSVARRWCRS